MRDTSFISTDTTFRSITLWVALVAVALVGCGGGKGQETSTNSASGSSSSSGGISSEVPTFEALDALLKDKVATKAISGYALQIYDGDDTLLLQSEAGICDSVVSSCPGGNQGYTVDTITGVASSSKWVTSTVVLAVLDQLVAQGKIPSVAAGLDVATGDVLTCAKADGGRGATVTIRQLLSFTSGLLPEHACVGDNAFTMQQCACAILKDSAAKEVAGPNDGTPNGNAQPPGSVYKYGSTHQVIAAAMAEVATGSSFANLFQTLVKQPSGMEATFTNPTNVSGSLHSTVADYVKFVRALFHDGQPGGTGVLLSAAAVAEQEKSQMPPGVVYLMTPQPGLEYGLNTWRWCAKTVSAEALLALDAVQIQSATDPTCSEVHQTGHGGKGGYQPFLDRKRGFYGVFSMREPSPGAGDQYSPEELSLTTAVRMYAGLVVDEMRK